MPPVSPASESPQAVAGEHLVSAFEHALIGMALLDLDGRLLRANPAYCELIGYSEDELRQLSLSDVVRPEDAAVDLIERGSLTSGRTSSYRREKRYRHKTGRAIWGDYCCTLVRDESGKPCYYIGQVQDISERKAAQEALHETQSLLTIAAEVGRLGAWGWDVGSGRCQCSSEVCAILGLPAGIEPTTAELLSTLAPEYRGVLRATLRRCLADGSPFDVEAEALHGASGRVWVRIICEAQWDAKGRVRRLHGAMQDITQARNVQTALLESERAMQALVGNLPGMAYRCLNRPDWPMSYASEPALELTGFTSAQLVAGAPAYGDLIHRDDAARVWEDVQAAVRERRRFQLTYRLIAASGNEKWVWEQGSAVYERDGTVRCVEGFVIDITAQRTAQQEVARLNQSLKQKVRDRTQQLAVANSELEALAYSMAHDLRGPMTSLAGFSRILERNLGELDATNARYFDRIATNVRQMSDLTDGLLSLARLSRVEMERETLDLAPVAREIIESLQRQDPGRLTRIEIGPLEVTGDRGLLRQVMSNLLGNAWKFSRPNAQTVIEVRTERSASGETHVHVRDAGVGFEMAYASKLFAPFTRLHEAAQFEGTGIGLALVRNIVQRHGGRVWAQAMPGAGATFSFSLPAPV